MTMELQRAAWGGALKLSTGEVTTVKNTRRVVELMSLVGDAPKGAFPEERAELKRLIVEDLKALKERTPAILPEQIANQIAAAEIIARPAAVVKELLENSLDAGARMITIEIESGGAALIAVADDGSGMTSANAILSLRRHATSKIRTVADLSAIRTFGFRGEALPAIASVSHLRMQTRRAGDEHGTEIAAEGGNVGDARPCEMAAGTRIEVRQLFFNAPAQRRFLKTAATEQGAIIETLQRIALGNHQVAFRLIADRRAIFDWPRANSVLERFGQAIGLKSWSRLLAFDADSSGIRAQGLAATNEESFATERMIFTFVNGRPVRDRMLTLAIEQAYQTLIPRGRHPATVLFVDMPPEDVDVNVHPTKNEIRFCNSGGVFDVVYHAIRDRLASENPSSDIEPNQTPPARRRQRRKLPSNVIEFRAWRPKKRNRAQGGDGPKAAS
jgi:DNA mismatch repair protein MutL